MLPPGPLQQSLVNETDNQDFEGNQCGASAAGESDDGRGQRGFGRRVRQSRRSRSRSRRRRSSRSDSRSGRNTRDKRRHKRSRKARDHRDRRRRSACESQSENELQPEILALFDNNNPYANADSISRSTSVMKKVSKAGVVQTVRPKRAYVCGLLSNQSCLECASHK